MTEVMPSRPTDGSAKTLVTPVIEPTPKSVEVRKEALSRLLQSQIATGFRIESQSDTQAVLVKGHRPNNLLHFIVGIFTAGLWWLVWAGIALFGGEKREMASVDEWANASIQRL